MKRILILTAGYGEGHNAAARALAAGCTALGLESEVRDLFLETYGHRQETARRLYLQCIERMPLLWAAIYRAMDYRPIGWLSMQGLGPLRRTLATVLAERKPDAIVSVYPAYGHLLDQLGATLPQWTLITDSISVNSIWYTRGTRGYIVANEATAAVLRSHRIPAEKIHALGFPVRLAFADARPARPEPGPNEPLRVFFMMNHAPPGIASLLRGIVEQPGVRLTIAVGRNDALAREIRHAAPTATVLGWVDDIPRQIMEHHILIGKAGGAATQETLAAGTPFLITQIVPGQEEGNARLIVETGSGLLATTPQALADAIRALRENDSALWKKMATAAKTAGHPDSARQIARFLLASPEMPASTSRNRS